MEVSAGKGRDGKIVNFFGYGGLFLLYSSCLADNQESKTSSTGLTLYRSKLWGSEKGGGREEGRGKRLGGIGNGNVELGGKKP